ncbi:MAG: CCA tRNA nucleotidyltransferase [Thermoleophilia bacterium]|nr:CCA tRNA nucleotidyltransferase [Thermoleophilia bacterium]
MKESPLGDSSRLSAFVEGNSLLSDLAAQSQDQGRIYMVGGAVRDVLSGVEITDIDLVIEGDAAALATSLADDALVYERFGTAEAMVDGIRVDVAAARRETYAFPGALPEVSPASIIEDLARRDFTINAMAIALDKPGDLLDPHGGRADLGRGVMRVIHPFSFADDPTRALRAARYAARFGFALDPLTSDLLADVDLGTVSRERTDNEFELIAAEPTGIEAFRLLTVWGLIEVPAERLELATRAIEVLDSKSWQGRVTRGDATNESLFGRTPHVPVEMPETPFIAVTVASRLSLAELLVNRAAGALWLDRYLDEWSTIRPSITGDDLVLAGLPQGPAIGIGLTAALRARLDDGVEGIEEELAIAVEAAEGYISDGGTA